MALVRQGNALLRKNGVLAKGSSCCCGCPTCPDLCGYYIEAQSGGGRGYPVGDDLNSRVEANAEFCTEGTFLRYPRPGQNNVFPGVEVEGNSGLPSACGLGGPGGTHSVQYSTSGSTSASSTSASISVTLLSEALNRPQGGASLSLSCNNGSWTATVTWQVGRADVSAGCSASKSFPIRPSCSEDATCPVPGQSPGEGSNIDGLVFIVSGDGVDVQGIGNFPFDAGDRLGNCSGDACLQAWRALYQARFEVYRVPCACLGSCDAQNPCGEGCVCVDGQCVGERGCCCINGEAVQGFSEQECEACNTTYTCFEFMQLEDPSQPCPEGWQPGGEGFCLRSTVVESCEQCAGTCLTQQTGNCGTWIEGSDTCAGYRGLRYLRDNDGFSVCGECQNIVVGPNGIFRPSHLNPWNLCDDDPSGQPTAWEKAGIFETGEECSAALQAAVEGNPAPEGCEILFSICMPVNLCPNAFP
jgi:hypothetical protein